MPAPLCAYCRTQPVSDQFRPFCSERCKQADLGRWLTGGYVIEGKETDAPALRAFERGDHDISDEDDQ